MSNKRFFTDAQLENLQAYQDGLEAFRCSNGNGHDNVKKSPVLLVTPTGLICPDINCANTKTDVPAEILNGHFRH